MLQFKRLIDISQPISTTSAVFPGDTEFKKEIVLTYEQSKIVNLTQFTMSPHIGTHIDAPAHIKGDMSEKSELVGNMPLEPLIGEAYVVDLAPCEGAISWSLVETKLSALTPLPSRILFRTQNKIRYDVFEEEYSFFATDLVNELNKRGVKVLGIDAPSADHVRSKTLDAHHELDRNNMIWIENLDLSEVSEGRYILIAFPLKFMELEASPTRAVLLEI